MADTSDADSGLRLAGSVCYDSPVRSRQASVLLPDGTVFHVADLADTGRELLARGIKANEVFRVLYKLDLEGLTKSNRLRFAGFARLEVAERDGRRDARLHLESLDRLRWMQAQESERGLILYPEPMEFNPRVSVDPYFGERALAVSGSIHLSSRSQPIRTATINYNGQVSHVKVGLWDDDDCRVAAIAALLARSGAVVDQVFRVFQSDGPSARSVIHRHPRAHDMDYAVLHKVQQKGRTVFQLEYGDAEHMVRYAPLEPEPELDPEPYPEPPPTPPSSSLSSSDGSDLDV